MSLARRDGPLGRLAAAAAADAALAAEASRIAAADAAGADSAALSVTAAEAAVSITGATTAGGGDGTVNGVAAALVDTGIALGVLPLGTLNHFAKDLGVPLDLEAAVRTIVAGQAHAVDVGEVNGRIFVNNSSLGIYPEIVRDRERQQKRFGRNKWLAMAWATLAVLRRYPFLGVRLAVDGRPQFFRTPFVFIGNNEYQMDGLALGQRAALDGGVLSLFVAQRPGRLRLIQFALRALFGRLRQARDFAAVRASEVVVESRRHRLHVATDGEVGVMTPPLRYRIRPASLRVMRAAPGDAAAD
jgi:diacylglycerol kinase family enzyme